MPQVTYKVKIGSIFKCHSSETIGTDGASPCIAILAVLDSGNYVICGHLSNNKQVKIEVEKLKKIIVENFGMMVDKIGFVSGSSYELARQALQELHIGNIDEKPPIKYPARFGSPAFERPMTNQADGIWWDGERIRYATQTVTVRGTQCGNKSFDYSD